MVELIVDLLYFAFLGAIVVAILGVALRNSRNRQMQLDVLQRGVEVEAEILGRFEAGALQGSELGKARQSLMATWDPLELELRYLCDGREIVSRGQVSIETFFRTRSRKTLKIKVSPEHPEQWAALA
jgi:hypothetical protein